MATTTDQDAALQQRLAAARPEELRVMLAFFNTPRLRKHFNSMVEQIEREISSREPPK